MFKIDEDIKKDNNLWAFNKDKNQLEFKYTEEIKENYQTLFKTIFAGINVDESTPQGQIITTLTQVDLLGISFLTNLANAFFLGGNGYFLDLWSYNLYRVTRKEGIPASVLVNIQGVAGTEIPADFIVSDGEDNYKISKAIKIPEEGNIEVLFYNTEINKKIPEVNSIDKMVTVINGVERINNNSRGNEAIFKESDDELYKRCIDFKSTAKNASFISILANVFQVQGVIKVTGEENTTNSVINVNGVSINPHSICIVVEGGDDNDIANAIFSSRATGCGMMGDVSVVISYNGLLYEVNFYRPKYIILKAEVILLEKKEPPSNFEDLIKNNLANYINKLKIGELITQPSLTQNLYNELVGFYIKEVKFGLKSGTLGYNPIQLKLNEMAVISKGDISVRVTQ